MRRGVTGSANATTPTVHSDLSRTAQEQLKKAKGMTASQVKSDPLDRFFCPSSIRSPEAIARIGDAALALGPSLQKLEVNRLATSRDRIEALDALVVVLERV